MTPPRTHFNRYKVIEPIGEGAMGEVFLAHDPHLSRKVAIKVIKPGIAPKDAVQRFATEAMASAKSRSPNIVEVFDYDVLEDGRPYLVMEYVSGPKLQDIIERVETLSDVFIASVLCQILEGLQAVEEKRIVHRDIKPGNILITPKGVVKISDFGIARFANQDITKPNQLLGAISYMSPEQVSGTTTVTPDSDVFAVGVVGYLMASGQLPFQGATHEEVIDQIKLCKPFAYSESRGAAYKVLQAAILSMLKKQPEERAAKSDLIQTLRKLLADFGIYDISKPVADLLGRIPTHGVFTTTIINPKFIGAIRKDTAKKGNRNKRHKIISIAATLTFVCLGLALIGLIGTEPNSNPVPDENVKAIKAIQEEIILSPQVKLASTESAALAQVRKLPEVKPLHVIRKRPVRITSTPSNTLLSIDGVRIGYTPIKTELSLGQHRFEAVSNFGNLDTTLQFRAEQNSVHFIIQRF